MIGYHKIWKETTIPVDKNGTNLVTSMALKEKYHTIKEAKKALEELANRNFDYSKYKKKKVEGVLKVNDRIYYVLLYENNKYITEQYYIH